MILSASRRTDIPTFYSKWLERRIQEGFVLVRNPINPHQVRKISLAPELVDCFVFWTKNPIPMLGRLDAFSEYSYYFQFTLTGYGRDVEANLPDKKRELIPAFQRLSDMIGPERVIWRYDPIVFNDKYTPDYHLHAIEEIASALDGHTVKCVISFVDSYKKNESALAKLSPKDLDDAELLGFAGRAAEIVGEHQMAMATCAETVDFSSVGIRRNCCVDPELIALITGASSIKVGKDKSQRRECGCASSIDIGAYNTCANRCSYCYANYSEDSVRANRASYDWTSPLLCDSLREGDVVTERKMKSLACMPRFEQQLFGVD